MGTSHQTNLPTKSAAQAWNRNDARAAKTLSLRGQSENELMRKSHREAARQLSLQQNLTTVVSPSSKTREIYIDLHGLHPTNEATQQLHQTLLEHQHPSTTPAGDADVYVYVIIPAVNGKDKIGKVARNWLNEAGYGWREFLVPSSTTTASSSSSLASTTAGGHSAGTSGVVILGVDPRSASGNGNNSSTTLGEKNARKNHNVAQDRAEGVADVGGGVVVDDKSGGVDNEAVAIATTLPTGEKVPTDTSEVLGAGRGKVRILKRG